MKEFTVIKYKKEWGIFSRTANCFVVFCQSKTEATQRCNELNNK